MKISNNYQTIYKPIIFGKKEKTFKHFGLKSLATDVFQRTSKCKNIDFDNRENDIRNLYDETFNIVLEQIPIMKELGVEKPNLVFRENLNATASYDFPTNTIELSSECKKRLFAYQGYNKNNELIICEIGFEDVTNLKDSDKIHFEFIELSQEEKDLYIKSILAHELRHWAQEHIIASTKGCSEHFNLKLGKVKKIIETIEEIIQTAKAAKLPKEKIEAYQRKLKNTKKEFAYILNYKPKEVLDEDFKLASSLIPWETRYWSIKEHFLPASLRYKNSNKEEYLSNPIEIDAYYYQAEFLFNEKMKKTNIRLDVFQAMLMKCTERGFVALDMHDELGYPQLLS